MDGLLPVQTALCSLLESHPPFGFFLGGGGGVNFLCESTSKRDSSVDTCRKVLLKALQGFTGPFTQMFGSLFFCKQMLRTHFM